MTAVRDPDSIQRIIHDQGKALQGFTVVAIDGEAGKVAKGQEKVDDGHVVVHIPGPLGVLGHDVVVEADAIDAIDTEARQIHVDRIADWVKASPRVRQYAVDHPSAVHEL